MKREFGLLWMALTLTGCNLSEWVGADQEPDESEAWSPSTSVQPLACRAGGPVWTVDVGPVDSVGPECDLMANSFPKVEVLDADGTLKISLGKLSRGGYPRIIHLTYSEKTSTG